VYPTRPEERDGKEEKRDVDAPRDAAQEIRSPHGINRIIWAEEEGWRKRDQRETRSHSSAEKNHGRESERTRVEERRDGELNDTNAGHDASTLYQLPPSYMPSMFASLHRCALFILLESHGQERASSLRRHIPLNRQTEQFTFSIHHRRRRQQTTGTGSRKPERTGTREVRRWTGEDETWLFICSTEKILRFILIFSLCVTHHLCMFPTPSCSLSLCKTKVIFAFLSGRDWHGCCIILQTHTGLHEWRGTDTNTCTLTSLLTTDRAESL